MSTAESSEHKSQTSAVLLQMRLLHQILNSRPTAEPWSGSTTAEFDPPEPNCDGPDANLDAAMEALRTAEAGVKHALRVAIVCRSGGTIQALSTEQEAAFDLAGELVAFSIGQ